MTHVETESAADDAPGGAAEPVEPPSEGTVGGPYMGSLRIFSPEVTSSYTAVVPAVDDATDARLRAGYESMAIVPSTYAGFVYMPGGVDPTLTKYAVTPDGGFSEVGKLSFASFGVTEVNTGPVIGVNMVAPDKAYLFDGANLQMIVYDPEAMELTGELIDLSAVLSEGTPDGWTAQVFLNGGPGFARQREGRLYVPVSFRNFDAYEVFAPTAGLLVIDVVEDRVVALLRDERLADSIYTVMTASGDLYLFSGALGVSHQWVRGTAAPGGALRVLRGEDRFDPDYFLDLNATVGNRPASTPVWAGGSSVYLKAYHEERQAITAEVEANPNALISLPAWRYWQVDLEGRTPAREVAELPWTSTDGFFYRLEEENRLFLGVMAEDFSRTTLFEATDAGFVEAIDVTGTLTVLSLLHRTR